MQIIREILIVASLSLTSLPTRIRASLIIVIGLAIVVAVTQPWLSALNSLKRSYMAMGDAGRIIVSPPEGRGAGIPRNWLAIVSDAPGIRRADDGTVLADAAVYTEVRLVQKNGAKGGATVRGIGSRGFAMNPRTKLVEGRTIVPGRRELLVGSAAKRKYAGVEIGQSVMLRDGLWPIVGVYFAPDFTDGDLIADSETLGNSLQRATYDAIVVQLKSPELFEPFSKALTSNPALSVAVERQQDSLRRLFDRQTGGGRVIIYAMGFFLALGALAGTVLAMYQTVVSRVHEIILLRAVGFGGLPVAASIVLEAMVFACVGAVIGAAIAWWMMDGFAYSGAGGVFTVRVTVFEVGFAIAVASAIALLGALFPAMRAARLAMAEALRDL